MQAGYDYLLAPGRRKRGLSGYIGLALSLVGALLLVGGGGYYIYATNARSQLDSMNVSLPSAASVALEPLPEGSSAVTVIPALPEIVPPPGIPESAIAGQTVTHGESPLVDVWSDIPESNPTRSRKLRDFLE